MNKGGALVLGAIIGLGIGYFTSPKTGAENRADAKDFACDLVGQGQEYCQQGTERIQARVSSVRNPEQKNDQLQAKIDAARKIISEQVAKNAEAAKQVISGTAPVEAEAEVETEAEPETEAATEE